MPIIGLFFQLQFSLKSTSYVSILMPEGVHKKWLLVNNCFLRYNMKRRNGRIHGVRMEVVEMEGD